MPSNNAAYLIDAKSKHLEVASAPYPKAQSGQIVVKNAALAINPADWLKQEMPNFMFSWQKLPVIMGTDVAGEVVEVGPNVTRFKAGDRVVGQALGADKDRNKNEENGFQEYTVLLEHMTSPIPGNMSYVDASVVPLGFGTAACGLYEKDKLALPYPSISPKATGKTIIIWGGSTSVGVNAIQLAVASGFEVIATASPKNHSMLRQLGAALTFDYNSPTVVQDIIESCTNRTLGGAMSIGKGAAEACMTILSKCKGDKKLAMISYPVPSPLPDTLRIPRIIFGFASWMIVNTIRSRILGVQMNFVNGSTLWNNGVGKAVYADYLGEALKAGSFKPAPEANVFGHGLDKLQGAMDAQKAGVSAKKIVVTL